MRFIRYIAYILYVYYLKGPRRNVAYLSAISVITLLIYIQLFLIIGLLKRSNFIISVLGGTRETRYVKITLLMAPIFCALYYSIKEKKLEELKKQYGYAHFDKEVDHRTLLFTYMFLSFAGVMILAVLRKH
jgi:hypothetical protein